MSINLGTTEVVLGLYSKALQLATFTVEVRWWANWNRTACL